MRVNVNMPQLGESVAEGTILKWLKQVGETVEKDEDILEISTDKVDSEIPSPAAGVLVEILAQEGETIEVGKPIGAAVYWHEAGTCTYTLELREQVESGMRADQISQSSECAPQGEIWFVTGEDDMTVVWHRADGSRWFSSRLRIE